MKLDKRDSLKLFLNTKNCIIKKSGHLILDEKFRFPNLLNIRIIPSLSLLIWAHASKSDF